MTDTKARSLLEEGDEKAQTGDYEGALELYRAGVAATPEPFQDQPIATELLSAIGDAYFALRKFDKAQRAFTDVMLCPGAAESDYIRLRRGQIAFELGDMKKAKTELACAYMNGGEEIFKDEDPKYFALIKTIVKKAVR
jgi:tetratricopeptide (TPR) repeat protein